MFSPSTHPGQHSLGRQLRVAHRSTEPRLSLGTYGSVDVVLYPSQPGGRQSTLACLIGATGRAFVDSAHYPSWRSFSAAVTYTAKYLGGTA
ncbi:hypothetical protein [Sinomonas halotolerans]|uniref:Uncharacterized protein n=1 Tax=Sinomonas halotolerans TaxID=1644133 RepID=A0ABU9X0D6_9MICC